MDQTSLALAMAAFAFMMTWIWGTPLIRGLQRLGITGPVPADDRSGEMKQVSTMGGILFVLPVVFFSLVLNFANLSGLTGLGFSILIPVFTMLAFGAAGIWMDFQNRKSLDGPIRKVIFAIQMVFAIAIAYALKHFLDVPEMYFPFYKGEFELGPWFIPSAAALILLSANAVQSTTGVNGLTGLLMVTSFASYGAISAIQGQVFITRFCFTVVGALFGFLWFNIKPASLLMGRTGAFALGATLAVIALMTGQWPLLLIISLIPLVEIGSSLLDMLVSRFGASGALLDSRPLHNHLKAGGWSSTQILQRFWLVQLLFAMIGISLARV